ncbi:MAG: hypothetical protein H5U40_07745 [Polyangiaceae bacterium]|nr:hypothetical protein [Polyangiaceae bacterium]
MKLRLVFIAGLASLVSACAPVGSAPPPATGAVVYTEAPPSTPASPTDPHYLATDDYLVRASMNDDKAHVAKRLEAPTAPGSEGVFLSARTGGEVRSPEFWLTRPASAADAVIGATLLCFEGNWSGSDEIRHAPRNSDEARASVWVVGRVTDTAELAQGLVRIGRRRCSLSAVRSPLE